MKSIAVHRRHARYTNGNAHHIVQIELLLEYLIRFMDDLVIKHEN